MTEHMVNNGTWTNDRGAALVTVLLLVAVMAVGSVLTFEALGYSIKRTAALRNFEQSRQYAMGGEQLAVSVAETLYDTKSLLAEPRAVSFTIEGGRIDGLISERSNCFNLNSLVSRRDTATYVANADTGRHFSRLLTTLGLSERDGDQLVASLTDWIDSDTRALPLGAEDYDYGTLEDPYRTGNTLLADMSELYMVSGFSAELVEALSAFVCVDPSTSFSPINVNGLAIEQAPLLVALIGGNYTLDMAVELILARPGGGYADVADFWLDPILAGRDIDQSVREQTTVRPHRFISQVKVTYYDATSYLTSEIRVDESGTARIVRHHVGVLP